MKIKLLKTIGAMAITLPAMGATLTSGHVDFPGIGYNAGDFEPHIHASAGAVIDGSPLLADQEFEPDELIIQVSNTMSRDADASWASVGVGSGVSFWSLPEASTPGQPFVGIGAEELDPSEWTGAITITLTSMVSPAGGTFSLWQTDAFGIPTFYMTTLGGISATDVFSMDIDVEDHAHFGWGFTELGIYELTLKFDGVHAVDGAKTTSATYTFSVVPEPSTGMMGLLGAIFLLRRKRK
jgi:surface-anchored protein